MLVRIKPRCNKYCSAVVVDSIINILLEKGNHRWLKKGKLVLDFVLICEETTFSEYIRTGIRT